MNDTFDVIFFIGSKGNCIALGIPTAGKIETTKVESYTDDISADSIA